MLIKNQSWSETMVLKCKVAVNVVIREQKIVWKMEEAELCIYR